MPRAAQPSTGSSTTRVPAARRGAVGADGVAGERPHHLVAGDEGEADDVLEVARAAAVQRGQVRAADAGEHGVHVGPALTGQGGGVVSTRRSGPTPAPRPEPKVEARRAAAKRGSERSKTRVFIGPRHRAVTALGDLTSRGPRGRGRCEPPVALDQCSTCQPRRRAMAARRASGLTATGNPTASSMARSLAESA